MEIQILVRTCNSSFVCTKDLNLCTTCSIKFVQANDFSNCLNVLKLPANFCHGSDSQHIVPIFTVYSEIMYDVMQLFYPLPTIFCPDPTQLTQREGIWCHKPECWKYQCLTTVSAIIALQIGQCENIS